MIYFPHIIHSLHQLQDVQYDKSKSNIGFDGNAWGFEFRDYKIKKKQQTNKTPPPQKTPQKTNMICYRVIINHWRCGLVLYWKISGQCTTVSYESVVFFNSNKKKIKTWKWFNADQSHFLIYWMNRDLWLCVVLSDWLIPLFICTLM